MQRSRGGKVDGKFLRLQAVHSEQWSQKSEVGEDVES